jgi:hypothetical protein
MSLNTLPTPAPFAHANAAYPTVLVNSGQGVTNAALFAERDAVPYYKRAIAHSFSCADTGEVYLYQGADIENVNWQNPANWIKTGGQMPAFVEPAAHTLVADSDKFLLNVTGEFKEAEAETVKAYMTADVNERIDALNDETNIVEVNTVSEFKAALAVNRDAVTIVVNTPLSFVAESLITGAANAQILGANALSITEALIVASTFAGAARRISFQTPVFFAEHDTDSTDVLFIDAITLDIQDLTIASGISNIGIASSVAGSVLNLSGTADKITNNTPANLTINENADIPADLAGRVLIISNNMKCVVYTAINNFQAAKLLNSTFQSGVFFGSETGIRRIALTLPDYPLIKCIAENTFLTGAKCDKTTLNIEGGELAAQNITFESDVKVENIAIVKPAAGVLNLYFSNLHKGGLDAINVTVTGAGTGTVNIYCDNDAPIIGTGFTLFNNRLSREFEVNYFSSGATSSLNVTITKSGDLTIKKRVLFIGGNAPAEQHVIFPVLGYRCNLREVAAHLSAISEPNKYISARLIEIPDFFGDGQILAWGLNGHLLGHRQAYADAAGYQGYTHSGADLSTDVTVNPMVMDIGARNSDTISDWHVWDFVFKGTAYKINV